MTSSTSKLVRVRMKARDRDALTTSFASTVASARLQLPATGLAPGAEVDVVMTYANGEVALGGRGRVSRLLPTEPGRTGKAELVMVWAPQHLELIAWLAARAASSVADETLSFPSEDLSRDLVAPGPLPPSPAQMASGPPAVPLVSQASALPVLDPPPEAPQVPHPDSIAGELPWDGAPIGSGFEDSLLGEGFVIVGSTAGPSSTHGASGAAPEPSVAAPPPEVPIPSLGAPISGAAPATPESADALRIPPAEGGVSGEPEGAPLHGLGFPMSSVAPPPGLAAHAPLAPPPGLAVQHPLAPPARLAVASPGLPPFPSSVGLGVPLAPLTSGSLSAVPMAPIVAGAPLPVAPSSLGALPASALAPTPAIIAGAPVPGGLPAPPHPYPSEPLKLPVLTPSASWASMTPATMPRAPSVAPPPVATIMGAPLPAWSRPAAPARAPFAAEGLDLADPTGPPPGASALSPEAFAESEEEAHAEAAEPGASFVSGSFALVSYSQTDFLAEPSSIIPGSRALSPDAFEAKPEPSRAPSGAVAPAGAKPLESRAPSGAVAPAGAKPLDRPGFPPPSASSPALPLPQREPEPARKAMELADEVPLKAFEVRTSDVGVAALHADELVGGGALDADELVAGAALEADELVGAAALDADELVERSRDEGPSEVIDDEESLPEVEADALIEPSDGLPAGDETPLELDPDRSGPAFAGAGPVAYAPTPFKSMAEGPESGLDIDVGPPAEPSFEGPSREASAVFPPAPEPRVAPLRSPPERTPSGPSAMSESPAPSVAARPDVSSDLLGEPPSSLAASSGAYAQIERRATAEQRRAASNAMEIEEVLSGTPEPIAWNHHQEVVDWERQSGEVTPLARIGLVREPDRSRTSRSGFGSNTNASFEAIPGKKLPRQLPPKGKLVIGIDLGTTHACAAVAADTMAKVIPSRRGTNSIPAVVLIHPEGKTIVGEPALRRLPLHLRQTITGMNPLMGRPFHSPVVQKQVGRSVYDLTEGDEGETSVRIGGVSISFEEISSLLFKEIREGASLSLSDKVNRAVLTCPPYYTEGQRQAMRVAAELAGIHVESLILEPFAVAIACDLPRHSGTRRALILDLGGGSFDATVVASESGVLSILATGSDSSLGGMRFDAAIVDLILQHVQDRHALDARGDATALARLLPTAEKAKRELSEQEATKVVVEDFVLHDGPPLSFELVLTRAQLERRIEPLATRTIRLCHEVCSRARVSFEQVDEIVLTGGQSRTPLVRRVLTQGLGRPLRFDVNPDEAAALGAALYASALESGAPVRVIDPLTASIGVGLPGGRLQKIVERGASLPLRREHRLVTSRDNQPNVELTLFQGEDEDVWNDELIGLLRIGGLTPAPAGRDSVRLAIEIDRDHALSFTATEESTGRTLEIDLLSRLSPDDVRLKLASNAAPPVVQPSAPPTRLTSGARDPKTPPPTQSAPDQGEEGGLWKWIRRTLS